MEYNQNGVALPLPDKNAQLTLEDKNDVNVKAIFQQEGKKYRRKLKDETTYQNLWTNTVSPIDQYKS